MADTLLVASDENIKQNPNLDLAQLVYSYEYHISSGLTVKADSIKADIIKIVMEDKMSPYYVFLTSKYSWTVDEELLASMRSAL